MRLEMWAVPLSFTGLVALFGYVMNEVAKRLENLRQKRKTLHRLSTASTRLCPERRYPPVPAEMR